MPSSTTKIFLIRHGSTEVGLFDEGREEEEKYPEVAAAWDKNPLHFIAARRGKWVGGVG